MKVYRDGKVFVCIRRCSTCIFEPGNRMNLMRGRVRSMVDQAKRDDGCIPCHKTTHGQHPDGEAVCRGFFDLHPTAPLQIAERLGFVVYQEPE